MIPSERVTGKYIMEAPPDCIQHLRYEITAYEGRIRALQKLPPERIPRIPNSLLRGTDSTFRDGT